MDTIIYVKKIPLMKGTFGLCLIISGLLVLVFSNIFIGIFMIALGLNFLSTEGIEINLKNKMFRSIKSVVGVQFGKWKPCPEFEYVSIFKTTENYNAGINNSVKIGSNEILLLNLFYANNKFITFYKTYDKEEGLKIAHQLKAIFNIDILDATESEKKWLD